VKRVLTMQTFLRFSSIFFHPLNPKGFESMHGIHPSVVGWIDKIAR
jgi:hypothetical protein